MRKKKPTRAEINESAERIRNMVFKKFRLPVMVYFARFSCEKPSPDIIRALLLIHSTFLVTESPNIKEAQVRMNEVILQSALFADDQQ